MKDSVPTADGQAVLDRLAEVFAANKDRLGEIDGKIGDGDHGINMNKGFQGARQAGAGQPVDLSGAFHTVGDVLLTKVGGSTGPLYGMFFQALAQPCAGRPEVDRALFGQMLTAGRDAILELGAAKPGDKTLMDALEPAVAAYQEAAAAGRPFGDCLDAMVAAAEKGRDSTLDMVARLGRASRLGERSRGVLDAGATSCHLILQSVTESFRAAAA